jgi:quinol monooxygenase YgiN
MARSQRLEGWHTACMGDGVARGRATFNHASASRWRRSQAAMVLFRARIRLDHTRFSSVVRSLITILGRSRALPGCLRSELCARIEDEEENMLIFTEEWKDMDSLMARLRDDGMHVLLSALDWASDPPEIRFDTISETRGMELIAACREGGTSI